MQDVFTIEIKRNGKTVAEKVMTEFKLSANGNPNSFTNGVVKDEDNTYRWGMNFTQQTLKSPEEKELSKMARMEKELAILKAKHKS